MRLTECYIENFGKLSSFKYDFCEGLNIIVRENGYGKTTLSIFIKAMLYGLDANKGKGEESERKRYTPWQNGRFGGSLTFESKGKLYRIERTFGARASLDKFALYDAESGRESYDFSENIGTELFGIDADGFERTVFLSERKLTPKNQNPTLSAKLSNLVGVDGDMGNFDKAIEALEKQEKALCHRKGKGGLIWDIRKDINEIDAELLLIEKKKEEYKPLSSELSTLGERIKDIEKRRSQIERRKLNRSYEAEYFRKKEALTKEEERLAELNGFFRGGIPTREEIALFEGKSVERAALLRIVGEHKAELSRKAPCDIGRVDEMLSAIDSYESRSKKKPIGFYIHFAISLISLSIGIALGLIISPFLYTVCLVSLFFAFLGVKNLITFKKSRPTENELDFIRDFLFGRVRADATEAELRSALFDLKAEISTQIRERERLAAAITEKQTAISRLDVECDIFLKKFEATDNNPFQKIRERLSEYERILSAVNFQRNELFLYAKEKNIDTNLQLSASSEALEAEILAIKAEEKELRSQYYSIDNRLNLISDEISRTDELSEKRLELLDAEGNASFMHKVTVNTAEHLFRAKERLTEKYLDKTRKAFDFYISEMGKEDAKAFSMDTGFALKKTENGLTNPDDAYSLGTRELYALATRLALSDSLFPSDAPFVILDDPFSHFDDQKCFDAVNALKKLSLKKQIIYLTCSQARAIQQ